MKKFITKKDLKGLVFTPDINSLLEDINRKGDINGRYFSAWWFDQYLNKEDFHAMAEIVYTLVVNWMEEHNYVYNTEQDLGICPLREVCTYIGDKLNVWNGTIIKFLRTMQEGEYRNISVEDNFGLNVLTITRLNER